MAAVSRWRQLEQQRGLANDTMSWRRHLLLATKSVSGGADRFPINLVCGGGVFRRTRGGIGLHQATWRVMALRRMGGGGISAVAANARCWRNDAAETVAGAYLSLAGGGGRAS
jgi:hypothetical protein